MDPSFILFSKMVQALKSFWSIFQKTAFFFGEIISTIAVVVFYYTIFALSALPAKLFNDYLLSKPRQSTWQEKKHTPHKLADFKRE